MVVLLAVFFAVMSAFFFSLQGVATRKAVMGKAVIPGLFLSVGLGVPLILPLLFYTGDIYTFFQTNPTSLLLLAIMGFFQYVAGRGLYTVALKIIGNTRAAPVRETSLIHSVLFGIVLLNETITFFSSLAIVLILFGVLMATMGGEAVPQPKGSNFRSSSLRKGFLVGLVGAAFWGFAPILIKSALPGVSSPIMATWFSFVFGTMAWSVILIGSKQVGGIRGLGRSSIILFLIAGGLTVLAQLMRFSAIGLEQVVIIVPVLTGINPIFSLILSAILIRKIERINRFVVIGIVASAIGAFGVASGI